MIDVNQSTSFKLRTFNPKILHSIHLQLLQSTNNQPLLIPKLLITPLPLLMQPLQILDQLHLIIEQYLRHLRRLGGIGYEYFEYLKGVKGDVGGWIAEEVQYRDEILGGGNVLNHYCVVGSI